MSAQTFILIPDRQRWRIGAIADGTANWREVPIENGETAPPSVMSALRELGYSRGREAILAIPSEWCFAATIDISDLPSHDRKAMIYRLEEKLPFPAEEFVADFAVAGTGRAWLPPSRGSQGGSPSREMTTNEMHAGEVGHTLGVAVRVAQVKPIVDTLEQAGVAVKSIVPAALLAAGGIETSEGLRAIAFGKSETVDLVLTRGGHVVGLSTWPKNRENACLALEIATLQLDGAKPTIVSRGVDPSIVGDNAQPLSEPFDKLLSRGADAISQGRAPGAVDLRRDGLAVPDRLRSHRRALDTVLAAAAVLLIAVCGAALLRAHRYSLLAGDNEQALRSEFSRAYPHWEKPASINALLQSELRKRAMSPQSPSSIASSESALRTMQTVLGSLPTDSRFALDRMTFQDNGFSLEGRSASLDGASAIAAAARRAGWDVPQPEGHRDSNGNWSFVVRGTHGAVPADSVAARGEGGDGRP